MSLSHQKKLEVVADYLITQFIMITVDINANVDQEKMQKWYKNLDALMNKAIRERKFEARMIRESIPLVKECILRDFAEYLI